ncbi:hypothetical protein Moror_15815, partial [Moniliophthora roreri MCA 2997]
NITQGQADRLPTYRGLGIHQENKTPPRTESQLEKDIEEAEARRHGLQTQSILNPGGQAIPPLTRASRREILTPSPLPLPTNQPPTETPREHPETKKTSILLSILTGLEGTRFEEDSIPSTPQKLEPDTSNTSLISAEESDPFQRLLQALKKSPRSTKQPQIEEMSEDKKPLGSRPKAEPPVEEAVISTTVPVQMVSAEKEIKAALPRAFEGYRKDAKKFLREVLLYIALNPKAFTTD